MIRRALLSHNPTVLLPKIIPINITKEILKYILSYGNSALWSIGFLQEFECIFKQITFEDYLWFGGIK